MSTRPDVLVHWTGRQFDQLGCHPMTDAVRQQYIERLISIYRDGLWFMPQAPDTVLGVYDQRLRLPATPNVCFTELRPAHSRDFCTHYGRLGIGLNRRYLLEMGANPVLYVQSAISGIVNTNLIPLGHALQLLGSSMFGVTFAYVKPMSRTSSTDVLDYYEEHEWRIVLPGRHGIPLPPAFATVLTDHGERQTFRFDCKQVRILVLPDTASIAMAENDTILRAIWSDHKPELIDLDSVVRIGSA